MKNTLTRTLLFTAGLCLSTALPLAAQEPGRGGGGMGRFQEAIHKLFDNHTKVKRSVEMTDTGYKSRTVSDDPEIARTLQKHVKEMRERLGAGMMIRRWDPAFAELVEHYKEIDHEFHEVEGGVEMIAKGKTPEGIKIAQNHARIVSGFVEKGPAQMHASHPTALGQGKTTTPAAQMPEVAKAACPECKDAPKADCPTCKAPAAKPACAMCQAPKPAPAKTDCPECQDTTKPAAAHGVHSTGDARKPLPLLPHMAQHQLANMRDHLAAIQEITTALAANNFDGVVTAASRIGSSEQMSRMCNHMGAGAPGFSGIALNFHRTADTIGVAAKQRDAGATLKAVSATLQTCVGCHATYRQEIVDEAKWNELTKAAR